MQYLLSIWQTDSIVDIAIAAIVFIEREVISGIEVDEDIIEVETN
jgi:hypothetical protein